MKTCLLLIDCQNDFCLPGSPLYINGADADMHRLSHFITSYPNLIDSIHVSLDMHNINDIAHPNYWINSENKHPEPFTNITVNDVKTKKWSTTNKNDERKALLYLQILEDNKKFNHTIWPVHCVAGTYGANIFPTLNASLKKWMDFTKKSFQSHIKGMNRNSEHFGIFQSEDGDSEFNHNLIINLYQNKNTVLIAGQAKSHCVATSLKQILDFYPELIKNTIFLTDTSSNVSGCEHIADEIYLKLREAGMKEMTTVDYYISSKENLTLSK